MTVIHDFRGPYKWLSNFEECIVMFEGQLYPSSEHAFQAAKLISHPDRMPFMCGGGLSCREAKNYGNKIALRPGWNEMRSWVMYTILLDKFTRNAYTLGKKLIATGNAELIEGNPWGDTYWGVCNGVGENRLGNILMEIRGFLQGVASP